MEDWQQRVIDERVELLGRITSLDEFLSGNDAHTVMYTQYEAMVLYLGALDVRIASF